MAAFSVLLILSSSTVMVIQPGTRLDAYDVRTLLGAGGMGEVYLAYDTSLRRQVAIKLLPVPQVSSLLAAIPGLY